MSSILVVVHMTYLVLLVRLNSIDDVTLKRRCRDFVLCWPAERSRVMTAARASSISITGTDVSRHNRDRAGKIRTLAHY